MSVDIGKLTMLAGQLKDRGVEPKREVRNDGRTWYSLTNDADAERAELWIYNDIGWGTTAEGFIAEIAPVRDKPLDIHINSYGGSVFDGVAIYTAIARHEPDVTVYVDGIAASAASFIAMAGDTIVMAKRARMMIHYARGVCIGDCDDMFETGYLLKDLNEEIAEIYAERAGNSRDDWLPAMKKETWYSAQQAIDANLANFIDSAEAEDKAATPSAKGVAPANDVSSSSTSGDCCTPKTPALADTISWNRQEFINMVKGVLP